MGNQWKHGANRIVSASDGKGTGGTPSCNRLKAIPRLIIALFMLFSLSQIVQAKSCKELGYYDKCYLLTNTACFGNNPYQCKAIALTQWCYVKTGTCGSNEMCKDPFGPTGAHCEKKCTNQCNSGDKKCDGNGYKTCDKGSDGCYAWGGVKKCGSNEKCDSGKCVAACKNECSNGDKRCDGNGYQTCQKGNDGCLKWSGTTKCGSNEQCNAGRCVKKCSDQCKSGEKKCSGDSAYVICTKGSDGCYTWGAVSACKTNEKCDKGACVGACEITNAYWSAADSWIAVTVKDGDVVVPMALTNGKCAGSSVVFRIYEEDFLSPNDYMGNVTATLSGDGSVAKATWTAKWTTDCILGVCGDPEYYFDVYVNGMKKYGKSPLMWVSKSYNAEVLQPQNKTIVIGKDVKEAASLATAFGLKFPPELGKSGFIIRYPAPNDVTLGEKFISLRVDAPHANWDYGEAMVKYASGEIAYKPSWVSRFMYHINFEGKLAKTFVSALQKLDVPISNPGNLHLPLPSPTTVLTMIIMEAPLAGEYDQGYANVTLQTSDGKSLSAMFSCGTGEKSKGYECMINIPGQGRCYCTPPTSGELWGNVLTLGNCTLTRCEQDATKPTTKTAKTMMTS